MRVEEDVAVEPLAEACRMCSAPATEAVVFQAWMNRPESVRPTVRHAMCARHALGLTADMVAAGWKVVA